MFWYTGFRNIIHYGTYIGRFEDVLEVIGARRSCTAVIIIFFFIYFEFAILLRSFFYVWHVLRERFYVFGRSINI